MKRLQTICRMAGVPAQQVRMCSAGAEPPVLVSEGTGAAKVVTLNRPKALNSLNYEMVKILQKHYSEWVADPQSYIVMKGAGDKAFCAGGDIVAVATEKPDASPSLRRDFFLEEYKLNYTIKTFPRPHVALLDGIVMGGGVGLSVHGSHRIVSEKTLFAMPETGIGLFPDVGGSLFLPRLPYAGLGMYLALTGHRLKGSDCLHANVGTHFVKSDRIASLESALVSANSAEKVEQIVAQFAEAPETLPEFSLRPHLNRIAETFTLGSVDDILADLERESDDWAQKTAATLRKMSPTSLRITHEQLCRGGRQDPEENFLMEGRMVYGCMNHSGDFNEGVRALLLDKDKNPKWNPPTLAETSKEYISKFFEPRPDRDWSPSQ